MVVGLTKPRRSPEVVVRGSPDPALAPTAGLRYRGKRMVSSRPINRRDRNLRLYRAIGHIELSRRIAPITCTLNESFTTRILVQVVQLLPPEWFCFDRDRVARWLPKSPFAITS